MPVVVEMVGSVVGIVPLALGLVVEIVLPAT